MAVDGLVTVVRLREVVTMVVATAVAVAAYVATLGHHALIVETAAGMDVVAVQMDGRLAPS